MEDQCPYPHNLYEQLYSPQNYKKKFCKYYPNKLKQCMLQDYCPYAHHESEITIELIHNYELDSDFFIFHYKTVFCPFEFFEHDGIKECVYAHTWADFRRSPVKYKYRPIECEEAKN